MHRIIVGLIVLCVSVALGFVGWDHVVAQAATPDAPTCAVYRADGDGVITFTGTGDVVTEPFAVDVGVMVVSVDYDAGDHLSTLFTVNILDTDDPETAVRGPMLLESGTAQDAIPVRTARDSLLLDVNTTGSWEITIDQR